MAFTVFAGTFNPIHSAHLIIAERVREELNSDKILFIPAFCPPHRHKGLANPIHRLNMANLAIADNPFFEVSDIEYKRQEKSYSYLTIKELYENRLETEGKINFIIGADAFSDIDSWKEAKKLINLVNFIVIARPDYTKPENLFKDISFKNIDFQIIKAPLLEISSSDIRNRITENKSVKYLVPKSVEEYIYNNNLYK